MLEIRSRSAAPIHPLRQYGCSAWEEASRAQALVADAYEFGFPLYEQARLVYNFSHAPANPARVPLNRLAHARLLTGFAQQKITTPNNDTLYSSAAIDLSAGPVWLDVPAFGPRFYSISFFDACTNVFACIGTRLHGGCGGRFLLAGPGWSGNAPPDCRVLRAPGNFIVALVRIQADGPADYPAIHALQDQVLLRGPDCPTPPDMIAPVAGDPLNFVAMVNRVMRDNPRAECDPAVLQSLARAGIGPDALPLTEGQEQMWQRSHAFARSRLLKKAERFGDVVDGWEYPPASVGRFGQDYETRAVIALKGLWANIPAEQTYTFAIADDAGQPLTGVHRYRLRLPKEHADGAAFWSLSLYARDPLGQLFFRDNVLHRYALGSTTKGLVRAADGSVEITIAAEEPGQGNANWLPAPPGLFTMVMRVYLPKMRGIGTEILYPPVQRLVPARVALAG